MMKIGPKLAFLLFICTLVNCSESVILGCTPFGVRLALGRNFFNQTQKEMLSIAFNTKQECEKSFITIQIGYSIKKLYCDSKAISFNGYTTFIHKCSIDFIQRGNTYQYLAYGWTGKANDSPIPFKNQNIHANLVDDDQQLKILALADWGYLKTKADVYDKLDLAFEYLIKSNDQPDIVHMAGDYAYDLSSNNGTNYENFLVMLSQISASWPCIINTGNHEYKTKNDQMVFNQTFQLYGLTKNNITLLNLQKVTFILLDPYAIIYQNQTTTKLLNDFKHHLDIARKDKPIIVSSHYPLACSGKAVDCSAMIDVLGQFFDMMIDHNVVLYVGAHYHTYERLFPYTKGGNFNYVQGPYNLTKTTKYLPSVIQGVAGNDKSIVEKYDEIKEYTAAYTYNATGYGIITINSNTLRYEHFKSKFFEKAFDSMLINFSQLFIQKLNLRQEQGARGQAPAPPSLSQNQ